MAKPLMQDNADDKDSFVDELKPGTKLLHGQYVIDSFVKEARACLDMISNGA